ncbi:MAG TPA: ABC transporter substrate-binding protein, partial [Candidatus Binatia bacterium]|nr:ABC transporter substrate-binding protein [Candidatus Binatia bacterium]
AQQEGKNLLMVASGLNKIFINWAMHKESAKAKGVTESSSLNDKLKALKGLTIGFTNPGALTAHLAGFVTRKAGFAPQQDVNMIAIGSGPTWIAALENRKVDVALTAPPTPETAVSRGFAIPFLSYTQYAELGAPEFLMENLIVRPDTAAKDPELVRKMARAVVKANKWTLQATPEQLAEALKPFMAQTDPALLLSGAKAVIPTISPDGRTSERSVQVTQDLLEQAGLLKKRVPYSELVVNEFLPK